MALPAGKVWTTYHTDAGVDYAVRLPAYYIQPNGWWDSHSVTGVPVLPAGYRMRRLTLVNPATGRRRTYAIQSLNVLQSWPLTQPVYLVDNGGNFVPWTQLGKIHESYQPRKFKLHRRR